MWARLNAMPIIIYNLMVRYQVKFCMSIWVLKALTAWSVPLTHTRAQLLLHLNFSCLLVCLEAYSSVRVEQQWRPSHLFLHVSLSRKETMLLARPGGSSFLLTDSLSLVMSSSCSTGLKLGLMGWLWLTTWLSVEALGSPLFLRL